MLEQLFFCFVRPFLAVINGYINLFCNYFKCYSVKVSSGNYVPVPFAMNPLPYKIFPFFTTSFVEFVLCFAHIITSPLLKAIKQSKKYLLLLTIFLSGVLFCMLHKVGIHALYMEFAPGLL